MHSERRQSLRVATRLPCQWRTFEFPPHRGDLIDCFAPSQGALSRGELDVLSDEIDARLKTLEDSQQRQLLDLMNRKINLLAAAALKLPAPAIVELEISADGLRLRTREQLPVGTWLGVHMVLPTHGDHLAPAMVCHSTATAAGDFCTGVCFPEESDRRPLARLVMRQATS